MTDDEHAERVQQWFRDADDHRKDWAEEARMLYDMVAGRQYTDDEMAELEEQLRAVIAFNRMQPMVSAVKGHQINNRQEARFLPREMGDVQVSELLTGAAKWVDDECDAEDEKSDVFEDLIITGMGWSETYITYDEELDGKVHSAERISPLECWWDKSSKRRNLVDTKYRMRGRWMGRKDAEMRWPEVAELDIAGGEYAAESEAYDMQPHDASRAHFYENDAREWYNQHKDEVFVLQVQWWEHVPRYRAVDPETGQVIELSEAKFNRLKDTLDERGTRYVRQLKKHYYQSFHIGPHVLERGDAPNTEAFTLQCVTGKRDATRGHWFGICRGMRDPQRWSNKFFADIQDMLVSNRQGGAFIEEGALVNPRQAEEQWNESNPLILLTEGAISNNRVLERSPIPYPQGLDRMMEWAVQAMPATTGINMEMMGYANRDQPNVLEMQRKRSAVNVLADLFDNFRRFEKERGRNLLYFIQNYLNDGRLIRITGQEGKEQYVPLALDDQNTRYDIVIDQASSSPNQKEETFQVLTQILPFFAKLGVTPPPDVLEYLPLPSSLVSKWKEQLTPKGPSQAEQLEAAEKQAEIKETESKTELNRAKVMETINKARAEAGRGETESLEAMAEMLQALT